MGKLPPSCCARGRINEDGNEDRRFSGFKIRVQNYIPVVIIV
jgi:hypothetical protein